MNIVLTLQVQQKNNLEGKAEERSVRKWVEGGEARNSLDTGLLNSNSWKELEKETLAPVTARR